MRKRFALAATLVAVLVAPSLASAQGGPGFLFKRPTFAIGVRAGWVIPRAGGQLLDYTLDEFIPLGADTTTSLSFNSPYIGGEISVRPWDRWDITAGFGWTRSRSRTEYRRWIDDVGDPISQETTLQVVSGTLGAKYYLQSRGRQIGSLAWVPSRLTPYVGAGLGFSSYEFVQVGDFIDESTFDILTDYLETTGYGAVAYGSAGVDLAVTKNALLTAEARYSFSNADVRGSYVGFNDIDLSGLRLMLGLGFQF
jgi:hypothetical protein